MNASPVAECEKQQALAYQRHVTLGLSEPGPEPIKARM